MQRFRQMRPLQKFPAVHASIHNHFNQERSLNSRQNVKANRTAALGPGGGNFAQPELGQVEQTETSWHWSDTTESSTHDSTAP